MKGFDVVPKLSIQVLLKALFLKSLPSKHKYTFNYVRSAFDFLLKNLELKHRRIILPQFICPVMAEVCFRNNIKVVFIPPDEKTYNLDFDKLSKTDLSQVDAILVNHTFGNLVDVAKLKQILKGTNILIIEDFAQASSNSILNGDFGLISFHKKIANLNGGALIARNHDFDHAYDILKRDKPTLKQIIGLLLTLGGPIRFLINWHRKKTPLYEAENCKIMKWEIKKASYLAEKIFARSHLRTRHVDLVDLYESNLDLNFFTPQKVSRTSERFHFNFCLNEDRKQYRDDLLLVLRRQGVFADRMWYNCSAALSKSIINLPLKESASKKELKVLFEFMVATLKDLENGGNKKNS